MNESFKTLIDDLECLIPGDSLPSRLLRAVDLDRIDSCLSSDELGTLQDFKHIPRADLTYHQSSMMIIDGPLLSDDAFIYYLPRLARAVLLESGPGEMLLMRLNTLAPEFKLGDLGIKIRLLTAYINKIGEELDKVEAVERQIWAQ